MSNQLPSGHQIGSMVNLNFGTGGKIKDAFVVNVNFTISKVFYDIEIDVDKEGHSTRIYNVDSAFVTKFS